jgi:hypothetical protein
MPIKSPILCKKPLMKPIIAVKNKCSITEHNKVPTPLNKKISENLVGRSKDFPDSAYTQKEIINKLQKKKRLGSVM